MVLMGPMIALDPAMATPMKVFMAKAASRFLPGFSLGGIDPALVTSDQVTYIVAYYKVSKETNLNNSYN